MQGEERGHIDSEFVVALAGLVSCGKGLFHSRFIMHLLIVREHGARDHSKIVRLAPMSYAQNVAPR